MRRHTDHMKARRHELNLDPNHDPLNPAHVSDPACWITGEAAEALKRAMVERIGMLRHAPTLPKSELDLTDQIEIDDSGRYHLKP